MRVRGRVVGEGEGEGGQHGVALLPNPTSRCIGGSSDEGAAPRMHRLLTAHHAAPVTPAMCITVGKVSLEDWPLLTWSLGCTSPLSPSLPPSSWIALRRRRRRRRRRGGGAREAGGGWVGNLQHDLPTIPCGLSAALPPLTCWR